MAFSRLPFWGVSSSLQLPDTPLIMYMVAHCFLEASGLTENAKTQFADQDATATTSGAQAEQGQLPQAGGVVKHVLSQELLLYLERVKSLLQGKSAILDNCD
jgi:hypothetical protein